MLGWLPRAVGNTCPFHFKPFFPFDGTSPFAESATLPRENEGDVTGDTERRACDAVEDPWRHRHRDFSRKENLQVLLTVWLLTDP